MTQRRWPLVLALTAALLVALGVGWAAGRATALSSTAPTASTSARAVEIVNGVPVGVEHSRTGALAASDNYVATSSETVVQDPARYQQLVRTAYAPDYQATALREGQQVRAQSPQAIQNYTNGGHGLAIVAARRLDSYSATTAQTTTWTGGFTWGPKKRPGQRWFLTETTLRWDGQRWLVQRLDQATRPAPAPAVVGYSDPSALATPTFDRELRGMTAPIYGGA